MTDQTQHQPVSRNLRRERRRWDDASIHAPALGCVACVDRETCGGQHRKQDRYSCLDDCCGNPAACDLVCPRNRTEFIKRMREINGFDLANIPRTDAQRTAFAAPYAPMIYHKNSRSSLLDAPAVAIPLHKLYDKRKGVLRYRTRAELSAEFRFRADARVVAVGSGRDKPIEAWWGLSEKRAEVVAALRDIGIELVTSPNYSLFTDQPRHDDLYNIKRIATVWQEIVAGGQPCALHLNARTERDYDRLVEFITARPEVTEVAFEFKTGASWRGRREFHDRHLAALAHQVGRPLHLIMVGGFPLLPSLASAYSQVSFVDTSAFMGAMHRQLLVEGNDGKLIKKTEDTAAGQPVDDLLARNIETMHRRVERIINSSRPKAA